jgi:uncharacterized protein YjbI with pentapeptide repeats
MANQEQLNKLREGVEAWNKWRAENQDVQINLYGADLWSDLLDGADPFEAILRGVNLSGVNLDGALLVGAHLGSANLSGANLSSATLLDAKLSGAHLDGTNLSGTDLDGAHLDGADLRGANLDGADLRGANLSGANLDGAFFDTRTTLNNVTFSDKGVNSVSVADVHWGGVNLAVVDWEPVQKLGEEYQACRSHDQDNYQTAVRANRQLAVVLREQGLNEQADHFAYRAQLLQRVVWRLRRKPLKYLFSLFLDLLAGYGYRPVRSIIAYLLVISSFAFIYAVLTHFLHAQPYPLAWYEALVLSVSSFHGRGFFQPVQSLGDPVAIAASVEAVLGLLIEISFIATFTQRFFGR